MSRVDIPVIKGAPFEQIYYDTSADEYTVKSVSGEVRSIPRWVLEDYPETDKILENQRRLMLYGQEPQLTKTNKVLLLT